MGKEQLELDLKRLEKQFNKVPTKVLYEKHGEYTIRSIQKYYGKWSNALKEVFGVEPKIPKSQESFCLQCGTKTKNPKFCSRTCSTTFNNKEENGRTIGRTLVQKNCVICGKQITRTPKQRIKKHRCNDCKLLIKTNNGSMKHIEQATKADVCTNDTQKYKRIRDYARRHALANSILEKCLICGYSNHVECAHIKSIADFEESTPLTTINDLSNLCGLCPNHHWEYDHGVIKINSSYHS